MNKTAHGELKRKSERRAARGAWADSWDWESGWDSVSNILADLRPPCRVKLSNFAENLTFESPDPSPPPSPSNFGAAPPPLAASAPTLTRALASALDHTIPCEPAVREVVLFQF